MSPNLTNTVRKKVWLCVNLALLGFVVATGFALYSNHRLKVHLIHIRDLDFYLAMGSAELLKQFEVQKYFYEESFLFGIPESAEKGNDLCGKILHLIETIAPLSHDSEQLHENPGADFRVLGEAYRSYAEKAANLYPLLASGEDPERHLSALQELAAAQSDLGNQFRDVASYFRDAFNSHVSSQIELADRNNRLLAGFLLALLALTALIVNLAAKAMLISPLAHIKEAVRAYGRGQRAFPELEAMDPRDDIGSLGISFLNMAEELQATTVSKEYVDSILRNMNDSLIVTSTNFVIQRVNRATLELLGYGESYLVGESIGLVLKDFPRRESDCELDGDFHLTPHLCSNAEGTLIAENGREIPVLLSISWLKEGTSTAQGLVYVAKDITERKMAEQRLEQMARIDFLTGLPNRLVFNERLKQSIHRAHRLGSQTGLIFLDLDRFKEINDTLGHAAGDSLLTTLSQRLADCVRENDTVARLGGDEFAVILENICQRKDATITARRLLETCIEPVIHEGKMIYPSVSIGIALYPLDAHDIEDLLKKSDQAMYRAKQEGGARFRFFAEEMKEERCRPRRDVTVAPGVWGTK